MFKLKWNGAKDALKPHIHFTRKGFFTRQNIADEMPK